MVNKTDEMKITDLRSAIDLLKSVPGQLIETNEMADPDAEISGIYRYVGAGGTVMRPTRIGPAMTSYFIRHIFSGILS